MLFLKNFSESTKRYFLSFFELQFVIMIFSLPLLTLWGLPISIMAPIANIIFTPLLIIFLWLSCIITICIALQIPPGILETALEKISIFWIYLLSFSKSSWLIGFPIESIILTFSIIIIIITWYSFIKTSQEKTVLFLTFCWSIILFLQPLFIKKNQLKKIGDLPLWSLNIGNKTYLIDNGALCRKKNIHNNLDYTILPSLIYYSGFTKIDSIIFCKPSTKMTKVAKLCSEQFNCENFLVTHKLQSYKTMKNYFKNTTIKILPIYQNKSSI